MFCFEVRLFNFKKNSVFLGTLILSFSGLLCRGIGFFYRLFISHAFGEEAMGIFQLTAPVLMLAFSLTCAGMQTAISRYTASCSANNNRTLAAKYMFSGCLISLTLSLLYSVIVYSQAENISIFILQEKRCAPLLRICALSFPFSALHSCFNGYFYGLKNTKIPSITQITEQLIRVSCVFLLYHYFLSQNKTPTIALTCIGMLTGECMSFIISFLAYIFQSQSGTTLDNFFHFSNPHQGIPHSLRNFSSSKNTATPGFLTITGHLLCLSFPLTLNRVIVNLLLSYEAISIPSRLKDYGYSTPTALSIYGVLTGMALSLVMFPSTFTNSASVLLLPSISEAASKDNFSQIKKTIRQSIFFSCTLGFSCTFVFFIGGNFMGNLLFHSSLAGTFIRQLSFLCPFLYLHTTLSSILNGLKKTGTTLFINITALLIRLFFTVFFISRYGIAAYLWGLLLSELFSSFYCLYSLRKYFL